MGIVLSLSWGAFLLVWVVGALVAKRDIARDGSWWRSKSLFFPRLALATMLVVATRMMMVRNHVRADEMTMFDLTPTLAWLSCLFTVAGIGIAIWARLFLGRNWSPQPARKVQHELVTRGPYRLVRHPIYTGMLLALIGLVLTGGVAGTVALGVAAVAFVRRISREERIMVELFPEQYPVYRQRTSRLIPFVW